MLSQELATNNEAHLFSLRTCDSYLSFISVQQCLAETLLTIVLIKTHLANSRN